MQSDKTMFAVCGWGAKDLNWNSEDIDQDFKDNDQYFDHLNTDFADSGQDAEDLCSDYKSPLLLSELEVVT